MIWPKPLIFTHIPKTAGTTVNQFFIQPCFSATTVIPYYGRKHLVKEILHRWPNIEYINAHGPYGIHRFGLWGADYCTILRNPVDRAVSEYYFVLQSKHGDYEHPHYHAASTRSMVDYFADQGRDNMQTRYLAGFRYVRRRKRLKPRDLTVALRHAEQYKFIGLKEKLNESIAGIAALRNLPVDPGKELPQEKKTFSRPAVSDISTMEHDGLVELHQLDQQIYQAARDRFWPEAIARE